MAPAVFVAEEGNESEVGWGGTALSVLPLPQGGTAIHIPNFEVPARTITTTTIAIIQCGRKGARLSLRLHLHQYLL
jgi:hypothetical protein